MTLSIEDVFSRENIVLKVPKIIDHSFIEQLVGLFKDMIAHFKGVDNILYASPKELHLIFPQTYGQNDKEQDFDLVFFGYLTLMKAEFPSMIIKIFYPELIPGTKSANLFYQLAQHQAHLQVMCEEEVFKLFINGEERTATTVFQSDSYLPILLVTKDSIELIFKEKTDGNSFKPRFEKLIADKPIHDLSKRGEGFKILKQEFRRSIKGGKSWKREDLSALYLIETLSKLPISVSELLKLTYKPSKNNSIYAINCRASLVKVLEEYSVFGFSDAEIYCFSLLLHMGELFGIPSDENELIDRMKAVMEVPEKLKKGQKDAIIKRFYLIYEENFRSLMQKTKGLAYGIQELAKNMVEHTKSGCGIITARIYNQERIKRLKRIDPKWISQFSGRDYFVDINTFDSGSVGICSSYFENLSNEKLLYSSELSDLELQQKIQHEYEEDISEVKKYKLNNFFDFNSIKLFHQINRTKARLGLLIFSQSILSESRAFVKVASNDINEEYPRGYAMSEQRGTIRQDDISDFYKLGTNYNFIVPIANGFEELDLTKVDDFQESSTPASVFLELQGYNVKEDPSPARNLSIFKLRADFSFGGKYLKLDMLKEYVLSKASEGIIVLDAIELSAILHNSSDWVRFLANLQFTSNGLKETIITGMGQELYTEIINILAIFDRAPKGDVGFWKQDRYVLFYIPIKHHFDQLETIMDRQGISDIFWFNSLLCGIKFQHFVNANLEINQYHNNMANVTVGFERKREPKPPGMKGPLFSASGKLLNFELLLENKEYISLFEETTRSLINVEIQDFA
ncbi:hypothetical protein QF042_003773 [Pedobacter sp. W3I1]|uniref:hypothetical protein n=1 Tax=Pedobacter sp. W3I1 TaxID=3042291 RepID=UPI0027809BD9|nr:hypothetical protein [Pedobacter sp. W3I1]MDQ0640208.1 hypothetical protein [Pedobacter sp. W3I1]